MHLARMSMGAFSMYGHVDERLIENLIHVYNNVLVDNRDKDREFTQIYAGKRFATALVAARFFGDLTNFTLRFLRELMPDLYATAERGTDHRGPAPENEHNPFEIRAGADEEEKNHVAPRSKRGGPFDSVGKNAMKILVHPETLLTTMPEPDENATSSVLHEEVSVTIQTVWKRGQPIFEPFCGLYFVDTLLPVAARKK